MTILEGRNKRDRLIPLLSDRASTTLLCIDRFTPTLTNAPGVTIRVLTAESIMGSARYTSIRLGELFSLGKRFSQFFGKYFAHPGEGRKESLRVCGSRIEARLRRDSLHK